MDGILPLWKERGMTSHDCVFKLRKILKMKKLVMGGPLTLMWMAFCRFASVKEPRLLSICRTAAKFTRVKLRWVILRRLRMSVVS